MTTFDYQRKIKAMVPMAPPFLWKAYLGNLLSKAHDGAAVL